MPGAHNRKTLPADHRGSMVCPDCGDMRTGVIDSRPREGGFVRRRRYCEGCAQRFTTFEVPEKFFRALDYGQARASAAEALTNAVTKFASLNRLLKQGERNAR